MREGFPYRRAAVLLLGLVLISTGLALFKLSATGNDPSTAFVLAVGNRLQIDISIMLPIVNSVWFLAELLWGRKYIGFGSFANWLGIGPTISLMLRLLTPLIPESLNFGVQLVIVLLGVPIVCLGCSMYQTANLGIAPYDAMAIILDDKLPIPYFWCRMFVDSFFALCAWLLGGIVGLGTLICALGLGPFIAFFTKTVAQRLCGIEEEA